MSPVFRHGGLRLYLLKLLDEAPRHGYEVIRLLQDRFLGVYSPSPGTIYPRLARLEEEGLVTHDEADGKKIYRITDKGRAEIQSRLDDLAELEEEITESVRDIAREVSQDVRDTVRNLREELTWAARDVRGQNREQARDAARERVRQARDEVHESAQRTREEARRHPGPGRRGPGHTDESAGSPAGPETGPQDAPDEGTWTGGDAWNRRNSGRRRGRRGPWPEWAAFQDRPNWAGGPERPGGRPGWPGFGGFHGHEHGPGGHDHGAHDHGAHDHGPWAGATQEERHRPDPGLLRDLERMAIDFARELRTAAWHTGEVGENSLRDLRTILTDTLDRIRDEVFGGADDESRPDAAAGPGPAGEPAGSADAESAAAPAAAQDQGPDDGPAATQGPGQTPAP